MQKFYFLNIGGYVASEKFDMVKFSSKVRDLLSSEIDVVVGNMEVIPLAEKLYKLVRAQAYNEGLAAAKAVIEQKMLNLSDELDVLAQYE
ncbi:DUF2164 family protein [Burkholderia sp. lig30]|jgi:uncharacterized protein (DUF2164 family)|uniref:DUF2164 family protein n=1 Tax=Burkholderia sp. lig30 TaxID=1192124 RepID=UPI00068AB8CC|nr:DUF2164 family protein [Burkholderia sp. lig30]